MALPPGFQDGNLHLVAADSSMHIFFPWQVFFAICLLHKCLCTRTRHYDCYKCFLVISNCPNVYLIQGYCSGKPFFYRCCSRLFRSSVVHRTWVLFLIIQWPNNIAVIRNTLDLKLFSIPISTHCRHFGCPNHCWSKTTYPQVPTAPESPFYWRFRCRSHVRAAKQVKSNRINS